MFHTNVSFLDMYVEVYDDYKVNVPCGRDNVVHSMQSSRVTLTYGRRLQSVFKCEYCDVEFVKLTRRSNEYDNNIARTFRDFVCVKYTREPAQYGSST